MELIEAQVKSEQLLLDPVNYRFLSDPDFVVADSRRFAEESVQNATYRRLRREGLAELKQSILTNGFLPFERIVVRPYSEGTYLVVEGNRRVAALRWIREDYLAGVEVSTQVIEALDAVPVIIVSAGEGEDSTYLSLMGVRHVTGIREWGGYQRARLVTELRDKFDLEASEVGARLGMTTVEVNRRYRAYRSLNQMEQDEEFGEKATPAMYPLFHEAVSLPVVRAWLGWDEGAAEFTNEETLSQFYSLITERDTEDGRAQEAKITTYLQVRELKTILEVPEAKRVLLDTERSFVEASGLARADELQKSWATQVAEAIQALHNISALELGSLNSEALSEIERLAEVATKVLETYAKLTRE